MDLGWNAALSVGISASNVFSSTPKHYISTAVTVSEIVFRESERQFRLLLMNDGRFESIKVLAGFFFSWLNSLIGPRPPV